MTTKKRLTAFLTACVTAISTFPFMTSVSADNFTVGNASAVYSEEITVAKAQQNTNKTKVVTMTSYVGTTTKTEETTITTTVSTEAEQTNETTETAVSTTAPIKTMIVEVTALTVAQSTVTTAPADEEITTASSLTTFRFPCQETHGTTKITFLTLPCTGCLSTTILQNVTMVPVATTTTTVSETQTTTTTTAANTVQDTYENLTYAQYEDHVEIIDSDKSMTEVVIPSEINGLPVTVIGKYAFSGSQITDVTIPDGVEVIETGAFEECSRLASVVIPSSVRQIYFFAFSKCESLESVFVYSTDIGFCGTLSTQTGSTVFSNYTVYNTNVLRTEYVYEGVIYGYENTYIQDYANSRYLTFECLDEEPAVTTTSVAEPTTTAITSVSLVETVTTRISIAGYYFTKVYVDMDAENVHVEKAGQTVEMTLSVCSKEGTVTPNLPEGIELVKVVDEDGTEYTINDDGTFDTNGVNVVLTLNVDESVQDGEYKLLFSFMGEESVAASTSNWLGGIHYTYLCEEADGGVLTVGTALTDTQPQSTTTTTAVTPLISTEMTALAEPAGIIKIDSLPDKVTYNIGEELDLTGLEVSLIYYKGGAIPISQVNEYSVIFNKVNPLDYPDAFVVDVSQFDNTQNGEYTITVSGTDEYAYRYWAMNSKKFTVTVTGGETTAVTTESNETTETTVSTAVSETTSETTAETTISSTTEAVPADPEINITVRDAAAIARALANGTVDTLPKEADYNGDGVVNVRDAAAIARDLAEKNKIL